MPIDEWADQKTKDILAWDGIHDGLRPMLADDIYQALLEARRLENEACAAIAKNWGYTFTDSNHQPWAQELNQKLRVQNIAVAHRISERITNAQQSGEKK